MKTVTKIILAAIVFLSSGGLSIADTGTSAPLILELLPGGTHFHSGDYLKGGLYLGLESALFAAGMAVEDDTGDALNVPWVTAGQVYAVDKADYSRTALDRFLAGNSSSVRTDMSPVASLAAAPFKLANLRSPFVMIWAVLGIADGVIGYEGINSTWRDMERAEYFGSSFTRREATMLYGGCSAALSLGAAVSEEMLFRGLLMPALDSRYGPKTGLAASSLTFGLMHLFNSGIDRPAYFIGQATAAGFVFGRQVQIDSYRLDKAVAAHFWYNFISMTTTWLLNPEENPIGFEVRVRI